MPFEVPEGWVWTTLGEISTYGECNTITIDEIGKDDWILELEDLEKDTAAIIQTLTKKERSIKGVRHKFCKGEVLYSKLRTYLNKVLVAPNDGYCTTEIMPFNSFCSISTDYLCHVLRSSYFLGYTLQCGYGVKMPRLSTNDARKGMIPLPPLAEQLRIVNEIERSFAAINTLENSKTHLQTAIKQAKNKILDLAIHGKLVPQDPNDEPASELLKRINPKVEITCDNAHYPQLPKSWCLASLGDLCSLCDGRKRIEEYLPYIDVKYLRKEKSTETISAGKYVSKGSLLILVDGENSGEVFRAPCNGYQGSTFKQLVINNNVHTEYLLLVIEMSRKMLRENKVGSAIPHLNKKIFKAIPVHLPPYQEQTRIVDEVTNLNKLLDIIMEGL